MSKEDKVDDVSNHNETAEEKSLPVGTSLTEEKSKALQMEVPDQTLISAHKKAYGSTDPDFLTGLAVRIANPGIAPAFDQKEVDYKLSVIRGAEPRNQFEAMLALQMIGVHDAFMRSQHHFMHADNVVLLESAGRMLHKLGRTFLDQKNALDRNRSGGDQKVTVQQHVSVNDGGQAIVGHVTQTAPANVADKSAADSPPPSTETETDPPAIVKEDKGRVSRARFRPKIK